jgi:hypothetical protein
MLLLVDVGIVKTDDSGLANALAVHDGAPIDMENLAGHVGGII